MASSYDIRPTSIPSSSTLPRRPSFDYEVTFLLSFIQWEELILAFRESDQHLLLNDVVHLLTNLTILVTQATRLPIPIVNIRGTLAQVFMIDTVIRRWIYRGTSLLPSIRICAATITMTWDKGPLPETVT